MKLVLPKQKNYSSVNTARDISFKIGFIEDVFLESFVI